MWPHIFPQSRSQHQPSNSRLDGDLWSAFSPGMLACASYNQAWYTLSTTWAPRGKKRHDLMTETEDLFLLLIRWGAITQRVLLLPGFEFLLVFFLEPHAFSRGVLSRCSNSYSFGNRGFRITDCIFDTWGVRSQQKEHYSRNKRTAIQKEQNHQPLPPSQVFKRQGVWVLNSAVIRSLNTLKREAETLNLGHKSTRIQSGE